IEYAYAIFQGVLRLYIICIALYRPFQLYITNRRYFYKKSSKNVNSYVIIFIVRCAVKMRMPITDEEELPCATETARVWAICF
ncbi:MAG: hypothetical protein PWP48_1192, partial [Clostridiales bacterium]|nr:hypothetical protein [Clostridiales bacterium]